MLETEKTAISLAEVSLHYMHFLCFQVSKYFSEIFKKLAPDGHAVLVMKKGDTDQGVSNT